MNPSRTIPEGVDTVTAEGADLALAIASAAESIGVDPKRVEFKYDLSHFRSSMGTSIAKSTVKIIAWNTTKSDEEIEAAAAEKPAPRPRRDKDDSDRGERRERRDRGDRGDKRERRSDDRRSDDRKGRGRGKRKEEENRPDPDELEDTEASKFAHAWFVELIGKMGIEGEVKSGGTDDRVLIWVSAERAGRLIGKRGSTLGAIRHLLGLMVGKKFGELTIDVDVADNRPRDDRKPKRERGERSDRGDRGDRGDRKDRGGEKRYPEEKLKALARRAAEKAIETGKTITINLELNSYDRRIVHLEVAEVDGVESRSEVSDEGTKIIQVVPAEGDDD